MLQAEGAGTVASQATSGAAGGLFGEFLRLQAGAAEGVPGTPDLLQPGGKILQVGGNELQPGGKDLPALPENIRAPATGTTPLSDLVGNVDGQDVSLPVARLFADGESLPAEAEILPGLALPQGEIPPTPSPGSGSAPQWAGLPGENATGLVPALPVEAREAAALAAGDEQRAALVLATPSGLQPGTAPPAVAADPARAPTVLPEAAPVESRFADPAPGRQLPAAFAPQGGEAVAATTQQARGGEEMPLLRNDFPGGAAEVAEEPELTLTRQPLSSQTAQTTQPQTPSAQPQPAAGLPAPTISEARGTGSSPPALLPPMNSGLGAPAWHGELAGRVSLLVKNGTQEASLQLNPPELGRLDIRVITEGDQARVQFTVHSAEARDAIEQSMPRLREMLEQTGLQLTRGDVAEQGQNRGRDDPAVGAGAEEPVEEGADDPQGHQAGSIPVDWLFGEPDSRVDYYV